MEKKLKDLYAYVNGVLYGVGVLPRCFSQHLDRWFRSKGYITLNADSCLYVLYDDRRYVQAAVAFFVGDCVHALTEASCVAYRQMF